MIKMFCPCYVNGTKGEILSLHRNCDGAKFTIVLKAQRSPLCSASSFLLQLLTSYDSFKHAKTSKYQRKFNFKVWKSCCKYSAVCFPYIVMQSGAFGNLSQKFSKLCLSSPCVYYETKQH